MALMAWDSPDGMPTLLWLDLRVLTVTHTGIIHRIYFSIQRRALWHLNVPPPSHWNSPHIWCVVLEVIHVCILEHEGVYSSLQTAQICLGLLWNRFDFFSVPILFLDLPRELITTCLNLIVEQSTPQSTVYWNFASRWDVKNYQNLDEMEIRLCTTSLENE